MKNLGKIILIFLISLSAFADVKVSVDKDQVQRGESVTFELKISGEGEVKLPDFNDICGYTIDSRRQGKKVIYANGIREEELSLLFTFMPERSCTIKSILVDIEGEETLTKAINITVSKIKMSKDDAFSVHLSTDKTSVYVGEPFEMTIDFKQRQNINAQDEAISLAESKNIWVKSDNTGSSYQKNGFNYRSNTYAMSAQQNGTLGLGPLKWDLIIGSTQRDAWGMLRRVSKKRSVFSNELKMEVKPLPEGISLVGELSIKASVDKTEVYAGDAVNLSIVVEGRANIEDIETFNIHIDAGQVFNEDPLVKHFLQNNKYFGTFSQKSAIVAERDFVIPSFELKYMDVLTNTVTTIKTEEIPVHVLDAAPLVKEELKITRPNTEVKDINLGSNSSNPFELFFVFLGGLALGIFMMLIPWKKMNKKDDSKSKVSAKVSKEVLQLLMANMDKDPEIDGLVKLLSENLYEGRSNPIDMKLLKSLVKKLQIS